MEYCYSVIIIMLYSVIVLNEIMVYNVILFCYNAIMIYYSVLLCYKVIVLCCYIVIRVIMLQY